jgi:hypothetical protein
MLLPALLLLASFAPGPDEVSSRIRCDTASDRLAGLAYEAANLRDNSVWVAHRKQWGWSGRERITLVADDHVCRRAAAALVRDGYKDAARSVAVVRVGRGYVAQPGDSWDLWIVLDSDFRVLPRVTVPS